MFKSHGIFTKSMTKSIERGLEVMRTALIVTESIFKEARKFVIRSFYS